MNRETLFAACLCLLAATAGAQQIGAVDLTHPSEQAKSVGEPENGPVPNGCDQLIGSVADGYAFPPHRKRPEIEVQVINVSNENVSVGGEVQGHARLRNSGNHAIQIPWSTDPDVTRHSPDPNHQTWQYGSLSASFKGTDLKTESWPLYGSKYVPGSMLTLRPGEWVAFDFKFKLAPESPIPGESINTGDGQLRVEWDQADRTLDIANCAAVRGFFSYDGYYRQENTSITIKVN
jgi:hypothetical protein